MLLVLALAQAGEGNCAAGDEKSPEDDLRFRLTEREDRRRPAEPFRFEVAGRPLTIGGEYEIGIDRTRRRLDLEEPRPHGRVRREQTLEAEAYYSFGPALSVFAKARAGWETERPAGGARKRSANFSERGEMWVHSKDIAGSGVSVDLGRLHFEDDRRWWWDAELDAVRATWESGRLEIALAYASELAAIRSDLRAISPEQEGVRRFMVEASWDWFASHAVHLFALGQRDQSRSEQPGEIVRIAREDATDARLTWVGARAMGTLELPGSSKLGYWLDAARVLGHEQGIRYEPVSPERSAAAVSRRRDVSGWALDAGFNLLLSGNLEPRLFAGYAHATGDSGAGEGVDHAFRQTGLHANESGFGGARRFPHYGVLLDPELSNLRIATLGAGVSLLRSSTLDLVYHRYRLVEPATSLRSARQDVTLNATSRALGEGLDLVLALEEWERLELEFVASTFRAAGAFGGGEGRRSFRASFALRYAF